jgi:peptidyl-prolyl cis-trans isomerase SurA
VLALLPGRGTAQIPEVGLPELVERVVAVVGDSAILMTEIEQQFILLEQRGWQRPTDIGPLQQAQRQILDQLINEQLLLQDAANDTTIILDDDELDSMVEDEIQGQVRQFGTQRVFQDALEQQGFTMASYRENRKEFFRRQLLRERYLTKRNADAQGIVLSEEEVETFYQENINIMPQRPSTIRFENYRLKPQPTDSAKAAALARAREVLQEARVSDLEFAELARRHSQGPSREQGGELGWVRRGGGFVEEFEDAVFALPPGLISEPVETEFGYHLILVERVRGGERRVRHILFIPSITDDDIDANLVRATALVERLSQPDAVGEEIDVSPDTLVVATDQLNQISGFYARALPGADVGDVLGPLQLEDPRDPETVGVVRILEIRDGGLASMDDMRGQIEDQLRQTKLVDEVVAELRARTYIDNRLFPGG